MRYFPQPACCCALLWAWVLNPFLFYARLKCDTYLLVLLTFALNLNTLCDCGCAVLKSCVRAHEWEAVRKFVWNSAFWSLSPSFFHPLWVFFLLACPVPVPTYPGSVSGSSCGSSPCRFASPPVSSVLHNNLQEIFAVTFSQELVNFLELLILEHCQLSCLGTKSKEHPCLSLKYH